MAEYIEREAAIAAMQNTERDLMADYGKEYGCEWGISTENAVKTIKSVPAADVAPVIRCKDCKHKRVDECGNVWCGRNWSKFLANDYDFCSRGERKEG